MDPLLFAGMLTTSSSALWTVAVIVWGVVWGAISLAVIATWLRPRWVWVLLGVLGPLGPLVALIVGLVANGGREDV